MSGDLCLTEPGAGLLLERGIQRVNIVQCPDALWMRMEVACNSAQDMLGRTTASRGRGGDRRN